MGEFLNSVAAVRNAPVALAHRIALVIDKTGKKALIVEAGDDYFLYAAFAQRLGLGGRVSLFSAFGKLKVIGALDALSSLGKGDSAYAIVDRDFDFESPSLVRDGHCFVLEQSSIESLVLGPKHLSVVGQTMFALEEDGPEHKLWLERASLFWKSLSEILHYEHAVALDSVMKNAVCYVNNVNAADLTTEDDVGNIAERENFKAEFLRLTSCTSSIAEAEIEYLIAKLIERPVEQWFRGHYVLQLLSRSINRFREIIDAMARADGKNRSRTRTPLGDRQILEAAGAMIPIPQSLSTFMVESLS